MAKIIRNIRMAFVVNPHMSPMPIGGHLPLGDEQDEASIRAMSNVTTENGIPMNASLCAAHLLPWSNHSVEYN